MKPIRDLISYLADYIDHEVIVCCPANRAYGTVEVHELIERGIDADQSTEDCTITITENPADDSWDCGSCRKFGETTCGNDVQNFSCFELRK